MPDHESIKHQFPLIGKKVKLCIFTREHVNNEYINWLNDYQVVKYSNQRFRQHSFESYSEYLQSF
jgi:[ribosomal protein S5]-alanine N-acetyltransferase